METTNCAFLRAACLRNVRFGTRGSPSRLIPKQKQTRSTELAVASVGCSSTAFKTSISSFDRRASATCDIRRFAMRSFSVIMSPPGYRDVGEPPISTITLYRKTRPAYAKSSTFPHSAMESLWSRLTSALPAKATVAESLPRSKFVRMADSVRDSIRRKCRLGMMLLPIIAPGHASCISGTHFANLAQI